MILHASSGCQLILEFGIMLAVFSDEMRVAVAIWYTHVNFVKQEKTGAAVPVTSRTAPASGCCTLM
eukprot:SAG31_NODE_1072_length_10065_cov_2.900662_2_plen_66_part_00